MCALTRAPPPSPIAHPQVKGGLTDPALKFALYEPVEFIRTFLVDKLEWRKVGRTRSSTHCNTCP